MHGNKLGQFGDGIMGNVLKFKTFDPKEVSFVNKFYGYLRESTFTINNKEYNVVLSQHNTTMTTEVTIEINGTECILQLAQFPILSFFDKELEGIILSNLPEQYQIISLKTATDTLIKQISGKLAASITIKSFSTAISQHPDLKCIKFLVNFDNTNVNACKLLIPDSILIFLAKHLPIAKKTQSMRHIKLPYHIRIGSSSISKADYQNLQKNDIIFFDRHILDKNKVFDVVGLDGVRAQLINNQVSVTAIY